MSETILDSGKSKQQESLNTSCMVIENKIKRLEDLIELWGKHADNEFEFGVIRGLQLAIDVLKNI